MAGPRHIEITETLLRLYVFLAQYLDRCVDETMRRSYPEAELQRHLGDARAQLETLLGSNRVVKAKVDEECERILKLGATALGTSNGQQGGAEIRQARTMLQNKSIALSDLLAVFRADEPER